MFKSCTLLLTLTIVMGACKDSTINGRISPIARNNPADPQVEDELTPSPEPDNGASATDLDEDSSAAQDRERVADAETLTSEPDPARCAPGFFRPAAADACRAHSICPSGQFVAQVGTPTSDVTCAPYRQCPPGQHVSTPGTASADRECQPHTPCPTGQFALVPATDTADNQCSPHRTCPAGTYHHAAGTATADTDCRTPTTCTATEFQVSAPTDTQDRVCQALTTCDSHSFESAAPSQNQDRQCRNLNLVGRDEFTRHTFSVWLTDDGFDITATGAAANRALTLSLGATSGSFSAAALTCGTSTITSAGTSCPVTNGVVTVNYTCPTCTGPGSFVLNMAGQGSQKISYDPASACAAVPNLAQSIASASAGDTICLPAGNYPQSQQISVIRTLNLICPSQKCILSGQNSSRIFHSLGHPTATLTLDGLQLTSGQSSNNQGGIIYINRIDGLNILNSLLTNSSISIQSGAFNGGAALFFVADYNSPASETPSTTVTLRKSAIIANQVTTNTALTTNGAAVNVIAVRNRPSGETGALRLTMRLVLDQSTILGNRSVAGSGAPASEHPGGVQITGNCVGSGSCTIHTLVELHNSRLANNIGSDDQVRNLRFLEFSGSLTHSVCGVASLAGCSVVGSSCNVSASCP